MSPLALNLEKTGTEKVVVAVEPAINAIFSMLLISKAEDDPGIHEWVTRTLARMSKEEQFRNKLVTFGFYFSILPRGNYPSLPSYLEDLQKTPASKFRDRLLKAYEAICITEESRNNTDLSVDWKQVLSSPENYVSFLRYRFGEELTDVEIETRAHAYVIDPPALKELVISHIQWFWKTHLQKEWDRVRPMLEESARAFNQLDLGEMTRIDLIRFITGQEVDQEKWSGEHEKAKNLIFIPNAHIGPYTHAISGSEDFYIVYGAHLPEGSEVRIPELDRAEIVGKLSALADDTRLQILKMVSEMGEMRSNEVKDATGLSQPSISRYLGQLTARGFLHERRINGAKAYTLNRDRIDETLQAVSRYLLKR